MKVTIVGGGAMGSLIGALLVEAGNEVIIYDISTEQVKTLNEHGLVIEQGDKQRRVKIKATFDQSELKKADLVVILVKSYDTQAAIEAVKSSIDKETMILTLQNGVGNIEEITKIIPPKQVLAGVTSHGAMLVKPGVIRYSGGDKTFIGSVDPIGQSLAYPIAELLNAAGLETLVLQDIREAIWTKLIVNGAINPLTAVTGCLNGELLEDENLLKLMEKVIEEGEKVAKAQDIKLSSQDMLGHVKSICLATATNKSSMLMDIIKKRPTEIDAINGMIALIGQKHKISTPVNETLTYLIKGISKNH